MKYNPTLWYQTGKYLLSSSIFFLGRKTIFLTIVERVFFCLIRPGMFHGGTVEVNMKFVSSYLITKRRQSSSLNPNEWDFHNGMISSGIRSAKLNWISRLQISEQCYSLLWLRVHGHNQPLSLCIDFYPDR